MDKPFQAYRGPEPYVFVCYAHEDAGAVYPELKRLHDRGLNIWYDEGISPGHEWTQNLADAIDDSTMFLYFVSPASVASRHCRNEVQYALEQEKSVLSVHMKPAEIPGGLKLSLGLAQAIPMHEMSVEEYRRKIDQALKTFSSPPISEPAASALSPAQRRAWYGGIFLILALMVSVALWIRAERAPDAAQLLAEDTQVIPEMSVAVLPFLNLSEDPDQEFFSEGLSEDILNELARSTDLTVRPRSSSFRFKDSNEDSQTIGQQLSVTHVVEGSVRRAAGRVRVSVQLIDVAENRPVWSERYDRELDNVFFVQDAITEQILAALSVRLTPAQDRRPVINQAAYDAFLRGRYHFNRGNYGEAERWLADAVGMQPENADAWALRAQVNAYLSANGVLPNSGTNRDLRREYLERSLSIDPDNATGLANRALMDTHYVDRNYQAALRELVRLNRLHPNNEDILIYLTFVLSTLGQADLVRLVTDQVIQLSPFSINAWLVKIYYGYLVFGPERQAIDAIAEMERLGFSVPVLRADVALSNGRATDLGAPEAPAEWPPVLYAIAKATEAYLGGDYERARMIVAPFKDAPGYTPYFARARIALLERDLDSAFEHYRNGVIEAEQAALSVIHGPVIWRKAFPEFFDDARHEQMLKEFKLDHESIAKIRIPGLAFLDQ